MEKLGLGIQELAKFRKKNLIYVDKTKLIAQLSKEINESVFSRYDA